MEEIVNTLRFNGYVSAHKITKLRTCLDSLGSVQGLVHEEKDPEELIRTLFSEVGDSAFFFFFNLFFLGSGHDSIFWSPTAWRFSSTLLLPSDLYGCRSQNDNSRHTISTREVFHSFRHQTCSSATLSNPADAKVPTPQNLNSDHFNFVQFQIW